MEDIPEGCSLRGLFFAFRVTYKSFPEVLYNAMKVNAVLCTDNFISDADLDIVRNSGVIFDSLSLMLFKYVSGLPTVITSLELINTKLDNYIIDGLKKLTLELYGDDDTTEYSFSSSLEYLDITVNEITKITLPPKLRYFHVSTFLESVNFVCEEMLYLENLWLELPGINSLEDTGIHAPNLKSKSIYSYRDFSFGIF